ncbi:glycosyltransferase WbuB [Clostridium perfringens]
MLIRGNSMKVLYIATSFPKPEKGSTIYTDLAEEMAKNGHEITVMVTEERKNTNKTVWYEERGCKVLRVRTGNIYDVNFIEKGISILTMEYIMKFAIKKYLKEMQFDMILYESPPVTNCGIVKYAKKMFNAKSYLMLKDIFPQNALDIGIINKNSLSYKLFKRKEELLYSISDTIGCMSEGNRDYILKHNPNINSSKVEIFPNTKKVQPIVDQEIDYSIRDKYKIPQKSTVFLFGGNMGKPQGVKFLCNAIKMLKDNRNVFFLLVGRGTERNNIKKFLQDNNCNNVLQIDNLPRNEYEKLVRASDVGLVLLDYRFTIPNYPSRILAYMEYGIPVLAATDKNTDFKELIKESNCGLWSYSNDIESFCSNVKFLAENNEVRINMGKNGRKYIENNFDVSISVDLLERNMNKFK